MKNCSTILMALFMTIATISVFAGNSMRQLPGSESQKTEAQDSRSLQPLKPLFEVFTSSTCPPCATANPIIDNVLNNNPGEYSLIKYQMNWPGSGDPYYIPQAGNRKTFYGVNSVPDMFANGGDQDINSFTQSVFNNYTLQETPMGISVSANIDEEGVVTVDAEINSSVAQAAGLRAHIAICEKETTGNVGTNGETEFHYVMMRMLPSGLGTMLAEIPEGGSLELTQSYNMTNTFAEELDDLVAVIFVQNNSTKEILQSEMVEVYPEGMEFYSITINVEDTEGTLLEGAEVSLSGVGSETTDAMGQVVFTDLSPDTYNFGVVYDGLMPYSGSVTIVDQDVSMDVVLEPTATNPDVLETFEDYTAGGKLVEQALAQGKDIWTCWSGDSGAGGAEDPTVANEQAAGGSNSVLCDGATDFVMLFGDLTQGKHIVSFDVYVPTGFVGYYNLLQAFGEGGAGAIWGVEVFFNPNGVGDVTAANTTNFAAFSYDHDTWFHVENVVDLNADEATLIVDGEEIATWQWSIGAAGGGTNTLAAMDIYAASTNGTPKMYFDNIDISQPTAFEIEDDLEAYTADEKLVEQSLAMGKDFWTCWSGDSGAGGAEDPSITTEQAASGSNSVVCEGTNDFVMLFGDKTSGKYAVAFDVYVPTGFVGYYNILQAFGEGGAGAIWGSEVYFNPGGIAELTAAEVTGYAAFNYAYDVWFHIENVIDLNADEAALFVDGVEIASWQWSLGAAGGGTNTLAAMDIYAAATNGTPKMYYDNFVLENFEGLPSPSNLTASVDDNDITLQWDSPSDGFVGFNVYRDAEVIAQEISETTYVDMDLLPGLYSYDVKAIYDEGVSAGAGPVEAYIEGGTDRDMVLLEIGTGTWCQYCPGSAMGADELVENGHNVAVVEYHSGDSYETTQSAARISYYGITAFPTAEIDGVFRHEGGSATISLYPTYLPFVEARTDAVSLFDIDLNVEMTGETSASTTVTVDNVYPYPGANITLHVVCTESHIQENWQGMSEVNFVMREMFPNQNGTSMDFSSSTTFTGSFDVEIAGYVKDNCEMVAFLQDEDTKEILQAAKFDFEDIVGIGEHALRHSINIYPNPANDMLNIEAEGMTSIRIMNQVGQLVMVRNANASSFVINVSDLETGLYFVEITTQEGTLTEKIMIK